MRTKLFDLLHRRRYFGKSIRPESLRRDEVSIWHQFSLKHCVADSEQLKGHIFLGFTSDGDFLISYTARLVQNDDIFDVYTYSLYWWLVDRLPCENRVSIKVAKLCPLFNGQNLSSKAVIWIHNWPNDVSKIIVHGVDQSSSLSAHVNAGNSSTEDVEYNSLIDILPNPAVQAFKTYKKCDRHDWRISISVPTQSSFMLPMFYRDLCVVNNGLVYTNGFSVKFLQFTFEAKNEAKSSSKAIGRQNGSRNNNEKITSEPNNVCCVSTSFLNLDKSRCLDCSDCFPNAHMHLVLSQTNALTALDSETEQAVSSLMLDFIEGVDLRNDQIESSSSSLGSLQVTEVSLGIEEMVEYVLNDSLHAVQKRHNLELMLTDYTTIILTTCPLSHVVVFKTPVVFMDRNTGYSFKSSFIIKWNFVSGDFEILKSSGLAKSGSKQFDYQRDVKPLIQRNWRECLRDLRLPLADVAQSYDNNLPFLMGVSKKCLYNQRNNMILKL